MQTFLPFPDFRQTADCLDWRRLGKQRVEVLQILRALSGESKGWRNHPAARMWVGYEIALVEYGLEICREWLRRGYVDTTKPKIAEFRVAGNLVLPPWLSDNFCLAHQSNLIRKLPEYYAPLFPGVPDDLPYVWPV